MQYLVFTHDDLDGIVTETIALANLFPECSVYSRNYANMYETMEEVLNEKDLPYYTVVICDLAIRESERSKAIIEKIIKYANSFIFADHHYDDSIWISDYVTKLKDKYQTTIETYIYVSKDQCGSKLFYSHFLNYPITINGSSDNFLNSLKEYSDLVIYTNDYDCWYHQFPISSRLNLLLYLIGKDDFIYRFMKNPKPNFTEGENLLINVEEKTKKAYISNALERVKIFNDPYGKFNLGMLYVTRYHSEVGNEIAKVHPEIDAVIMINPENKTGSIRSTKECARELASWLGGGGGLNAAGFPLGQEPYLDYDYVLERIFNRLTYQNNLKRNHIKKITAILNTTGSD